MSRSPLNETVFETSPNDGLRVVDAYGDPSIQEAVITETPTESEGKPSEASNYITIDKPPSPTKPVTPPPAKVPPKETKAFAVNLGPSPREQRAERAKEEKADNDTKVIAVLASDKSPTEKLASMPPSATMGEYKATGATDKQIMAKLGTVKPKNTDESSFLDDMSDTSFESVQGGMNAVNGMMPSEDYMDMMGADISTFINDGLEFLNIAALNDVLCPGEMWKGPSWDFSFKLSKLNIDIRKFLGCGKDKPLIDLGGIADIYKPAAKRSLLKAASKSGSEELVSDIMGSSPETTNNKSFKKQTTDSLLSNFKKGNGEDKKDNPLKGKSLVDSLKSVDRDWGETNREGKKSNNLATYDKASPDAIEVMAEDDRTASSAVIVTNLKTEPESSSSLSKQKYPHLALA